MMMRARSVSRVCYLHHISRIDPTHTSLSLSLSLSPSLHSKPPNAILILHLHHSTIIHLIRPLSLLLDFEIIQAFLAIHKVAADLRGWTSGSRKDTNERDRASERASEDRGREEGEAVLSGYERGWKGKYIAEKKTDSRQEVCAWGDSRPYRVREKKEVAGVVWKEREK